MTSMTTEEKQEYLADMHVGVLALNDSEQGPLTVPIWYNYHPEGELWFLTEPNSLKGKLLDIGKRVSLVVQNEDPPYKYVSVEGPITSITVADQSDLLQMAVRYLGSKAGRQYAETNASLGGVVVKVLPQRWLSVDYSKA